MRCAVLLFFVATGALAQQVSLGVVAGGSLTESFQTMNVPTGSSALPFDRFYSPSKDWIIGGMIELQLPLHFSIEADGLYRKLHFTTAGVEPNGSLNGVSPSPVVTWEFPVLTKYRFQWSKLRPFVELGPSFRTAGNLNGTNPSHYGITAGIGADIHLPYLDIAPTLRYTRWSADGLSAAHPNTNPDQVELLVAVSHESELSARPLNRKFSIGVIVGATFRRDLPTVTSATPVGPVSPGGSAQQGTTTDSGLKTFLIGPTFELKLPKSLSIELDAVYHPLRYSAQTTVNGSLIRTSTFNDAITWELPALLKYTVGTRRLKPFVEVGPYFRLPQEVTSALSTYGIGLGAGLEVQLRGVKIAPAFRYIHWASDRTGVNHNQAELLTGFFF